METYDYALEKEKMINAFEECEFKDSQEIIEWFSKSKNFSCLFESVEISSSIYKKLTENGYKEITSKKEELDFLNTILSNHIENKEIVGYKLISLIMKFLHNHEDLDPSVSMFIDYYNEKYNNEKTYSAMMDNLKNYIGSEVIVVLMNKGKINLPAGKLDRVSDFKSITINNVNYPFIGFETAILKISTPSGIILYNNSRINKDMELIDFSEIERINIETFGSLYEKNKEGKLYT